MLPVFCRRQSSGNAPSRTHRIGYCLLGLLVGLLLLTSGIAEAASDSPQLLTVDQAFSAHITRVSADKIVVRWKIADGCYLYRHGFHFSLVNGGTATLGKPDIPPGHKHVDKFFGPVQTYRHSVEITIPVHGRLSADSKLSVGYQGCADAGLCYPPQTKTLALPTPPPGADAGPPGTTANGASPPVLGQLTGPAIANPPHAAGTSSQTPASASATASTSEPANATATLAARLASAPAPVTLGLFLLLGIGLAFTPCILPMIPIVAGLIGSREVSRRRAFVLALAYVLAMAVAYAVFGLIAGYFGANIQAALQRPAVLWPFAALFVVLAGASFGWFDFQMPNAFQSRMSRVGGGGGVLGAAGLGFIAALVAGPCVAPPLAGALLYISTSGNVLFGGAALFCLGLGMGLPLIALAVFGAAILPKSGAWMGEVRVFFGVLLLAIGFYLGLRLASDALSLAAWGFFALVYAAYLSTRVTQRPTALVARRVVVALLGGYAALAAAGLAIGGGRPGAPLAGLAMGQQSTNAASASTSEAVAFQHVTSRTGLEKALAQARADGRPAFVDFYADWCVDCVQMMHDVFTQPGVRAALHGITPIEFDVTKYNADQRATMQSLSVFGPPTMLFYDAHGKRLSADRITGAVGAAPLIAHLNRLKQASGN